MGQRDVAVFAGGVLGTLGRAGTAQVVPATAGAWPWATFVVNAAGVFLLALLIGAIGDRLDPDDLRLRFLATGVLGSFTTFSAFAVEARELGVVGLGLRYAVVSVTAGLVLAALGGWLGRTVARP